MPDYIKSVILDEEDIDDWNSACGTNLDLVFVPLSKKNSFQESRAYRALLPCFKGEMKIEYYQDKKPSNFWFNFSLACILLIQFCFFFYIMLFI